VKLKAGELADEILPELRKFERELEKLAMQKGGGRKISGE